MEKNVILEEIGMYEDRPQSRLSDQLIEKHFGNHPLSFRVLGTSETVKAMSAEQMRSYFQHRYSPDNIVIAAAGRLDFDALLRDIEKVTAQWQPTGAARVYEPAPCQPFAQTIADERVSRHYIGVMTSGPSSQDPLRYAGRVLADVIGDSDGSRLYWALVDPGLADEADLYQLSQDQAGSFLAYASCDPERAEQVEALLLKTLDEYAGSIDESEISRRKNKLATQATVLGEKPLGRMRSLGNYWMYLGEYVPLEAELDRLMAVNSDDIRTLLKRYPFEPRTIVRLGPAT